MQRRFIFHKQTLRCKVSFLSINNDLIPALPLCLKSDEFNEGKNLLTLFIIFVLDKELDNSLDAIRIKSLFRNNFITPNLEDSKSFGTTFFKLSAKLYAYGLNTGTAFGPISHLPSVLLIQWGSKKDSQYIVALNRYFCW